MKSSFLELLAERIYGTNPAGLTEIQLCQIEDQYADIFDNTRVDLVLQAVVHQVLKDIVKERERRQHGPGSP